jgi:DNA-binding winged helix-turn-helix (wHTH) protein/DNA polymerase III delta prime subunit
VSLRYVFADFVLDEARFELRRAEQPVSIQPKVLKLLLHLVANHERAVTTRELFTALWPGERVTAASLKRAVQGARRALGERDTAQSAIRTVRGHGYQFALPVQRAASPSDDEREVVQSSAAERAPSPPATAPAKTADDWFVGRERLLADLELELVEALSGRGRFVLLSGEPGIGKTRTAQELARRAQQLGMESWFGRCLEEEGAPALWPWTQLVREAVRARGAASVQALMGVGAADLLHALPDLGRTLPALPSPPPIDAEPARLRFFHSMSSFLAAASEQRPLLIILDDLQRADVASLRLLAFLLRQMRASRALLVGTIRRAPRSDEAGVYGLVYELAREEPHRTVELSGLSRDALPQFVQLGSAGALPDAALDALYEQSAGNPLYLRRLLQGGWPGDDSRASWRERLARAPHDQGLSAIIQRHLAMLPRPCRTLLHSASVLGREFSSGLLARLSELDVETVAARLAPALAVRLLSPVAHTLGGFRFTHGLIRAALYEDIEPDMRSQLHARAALALEAQAPCPSDETLAEICRHFNAAAPAHDQGRALDYSLRAAESALRCLAYEDAAAHLGRALERIGLGANDPAQRLQILLSLADAQTRAGDHAQARSALRAAVELARALALPEALAQAAELRAQPIEDGELDPEQEALLREALARLPADHVRRAKLEALLARALCYSGQLAERVSLALSARERARALAPLAQADTLRVCHDALSEPAHLALRITIADQLLQLAHTLGDCTLLMNAARAQIQDQLERGDLAAVDSALATLEHLAQRARDPFFSWLAKVYRSMRASVAGDFALAERCAEEARQAGVAPQWAEHVYATNIIGIWRIQGRMKRAEALARDMATRYPRLCGWSAVLAAIEADLGREEVAQKTFARLLDGGLGNVRSDPFALSALAPMAELCVLVGDRAAAQLLYDEILPYAELHGTVYLGVASVGPMQRHLGMLAAMGGELERARQHYGRALAQCELMPSPTLTCLTLTAYGRSLLNAEARNYTRRAGELLRRGLALAESHAFHGLAHVCREQLKRIGPEPVRSRAGAPRAV